VFAGNRPGHSSVAVRIATVKEITVVQPDGQSVRFLRVRFPLQQAHRPSQRFAAVHGEGTAETVDSSEATRGTRMSRLKVSENRRFLVKEVGSPFFYLGDTAWELFHRASREEAERYLRNRAEKGFTVIQAVVLAA